MVISVVDAAPHGARTSGAAKPTSQRSSHTTRALAHDRPATRHPADRIFATAAGSGAVVINRLPVRAAECIRRNRNSRSPFALDIIAHKGITAHRSIKPVAG
jgi:hypothetical protein